MFFWVLWVVLQMNPTWRRGDGKLQPIHTQFLSLLCGWIWFIGNPDISLMFMNTGNASLPHAAVSVRLPQCTWPCASLRQGQVLFVFPYRGLPGHHFTTLLGMGRLHLSAVLTDCESSYPRVLINKSLPQICLFSSYITLKGLTAVKIILK